MLGLAKSTWLAPMGCRCTRQPWMQQLSLCWPGAEDLKGYARDQFELHRKKTEPYDIKYALSDGREQLKKLQETLAMQIL